MLSKIQLALDRSSPQPRDYETKERARREQWATSWSRILGQPLCTLCLRVFFHKTQRARRNTEIVSRRAIVKGFDWAISAPW